MRYRLPVLFVSVLLLLLLISQWLPKLQRATLEAPPTSPPPRPRPPPPPQIQVTRSVASKPPPTEAMKLEEPIPTSCSCSVTPFYYAAKYNTQLNLPISWLNLTTAQLMEMQHPNFPLSLAKGHGNKWCTLMPYPHAITWDNIYYQYVKVSNETNFLLYSAIFDNRVLTDVRPCIRIMAYSQSKAPDKPWCYVWFNSTGPPVVSRTKRIEFLDWQGKSSKWQMTYVLTVPIPESEGNKVPLAVSVVAKPCERAGTLLQVTGAMERNSSTAFVEGKNGDKQWNIAVCGPPLYYYHEDFSWRIVEWMEILRVQGVSKVFLGQTEVHPNIDKVLRYYEAQGFLGVMRFTYPEPFANEPNIRRLWYLIELPKRFALQNLYYTDCILRHMHEYRFIAHFDPDEVPMLIKFETLPEWLNNGLSRHKVKPGEETKQPPAHKLGWYYHSNDIAPPASAEALPEYLWAMRHSRRSRLPPALSSNKYKPVFDMDLAVGGSPHDYYNCAYGGCHRPSVGYPREEAYLGHYNYLCGKPCEESNSTVEETALLKYKDRVLPAVKKVLETLELLP